MRCHLNDDRGSVSKYIELLGWMRSMACIDGTEFEDIPNSNCKMGSFPFMEVEIIAPTVSSKFVIRKTDLYLSAFLAKNEWLQYKMHGHRLSGCIDIDYTGRYICQPWKRIGPKHFIKGLEELNTPSRNLDNEKDRRAIVKSSQIFVVLLSEACRFYPISSFICDTLSVSQPNSSDEVFVKPTYEEEEVTLDDTGGDDILGFVKRFGNIDFNYSRALPNYLEKMINNHAKLSKIWYVFSLSGKKIFCPGENDSKCHIKSPKGLRCTLGVLANSNLERVLNEWKDKLGDVSHQHHHLITSEIYANMKTNFQGLKTL